MYGDKDSFSGSTFVDSGTSMLVLPGSIYDKIIDASGNPSCSSDADCTISIEMTAKGVTLEVPGIASCHLSFSSKTIGFARGTPECSPDQLPKLSRHAGSRPISHGILNILENLL